jgi:alpha-tubulin suppressor-like RCC1 family protein
MSAGMTHTYTHEAAYTAIFYIRDDDGNEVTDSRKVTVTNRAPQITSIRPDTTISIKDSISLFSTATDVDGTIKEYAWDFTGDGTFEYVSVTNTTIGYRYNIAGSYNAIVRVTDDDDKVAKDTAKITVLQDAPIPNAGKDTTVSINDTVRLHGSATQRFGTIVTWEWDIGNTGTFVTLSNPDTVIIAPSLENLYYMCVLRVTDDDGNVVMDTVRVSALQDVPISNAGVDTILPINDTLLLHGSATQYFGTITRWEWKFGSGNWVTTSGPDTFFIAPSTEQTVVCSLAVTDDDGNRNIDEAKIVLFKKVISIAGGYSNSFFIKDDGTLWACGDNEYGKFGDGTMVNQTSPIMIMSNVQGVAAGMYHTLILKDDGSLWACGWNLFGQLCDGTTTGSTIPKKIMANVQNMAAGANHSLILKSDGTLWACGDDFYNQLCGGTTINNLPVQIMIDVQSIVASDRFNLILKNDGSLWPCGSSQGFSASSTTPVYVMSNVHSMDAGESYSLILKDDGTLWACGSNSSGQFGNGTITECHTPVQVMSNVQTMAAGRSHSLILKTDNTLWACGSNEYGQLGDGTTINRSSPVVLMNDVKNIDAGRFYSLILRTNGSLWACGNNDYGQLGDGTTINRYKPVRIIPPQ